MHGMNGHVTSLGGPGFQEAVMGGTDRMGGVFEFSGSADCGQSQQATGTISKQNDQVHHVGIFIMELIRSSGSSKDTFKKGFACEVLWSV